jgi:hypothetical protein
VRRRPRDRVQPARRDLGIPEDRQRLALRIVRDAGEAKGGHPGRLIKDTLDEPRTPAHLDELAHSWNGLQHDAPAGVSFTPERFQAVAAIVREVWPASTRKTEQRTAT